MCAPRRLRSAWASTESDQSLHCSHEESQGPGWFESSMGAHVILLVLSCAGSFHLSHYLLSNEQRITIFNAFWQESRFFLKLKGATLHRACHNHPSIVLICRRHKTIKSITIIIKLITHTLTLLSCPNFDSRVNRSSYHKGPIRYFSPLVPMSFTRTVYSSYSCHWGCVTGENLWHLQLYYKHVMRKTDLLSNII